MDGGGAGARERPLDFDFGICRRSWRADWACCASGDLSGIPGTLSLRRLSRAAIPRLPGGRHVDQVRWQTLDRDQLPALLLIKPGYAFKQAYGIWMERVAEDIISGT